MARKIINIGTSANDGTGTPLRESFDWINQMTSELYDTKNKNIDLSAFVVSDTDDLYAHESQILIHRLADKTILLVLYCADKQTEEERALTAKCILKVFELTTKTLLKEIELFYPGLVAGITQPNEKQTAPRMYVSGTTLKTFIGLETGLYNRDISMSSTDVSTWTAGNLSIFQMTMKNSGGSNVKVDVTSANVKTHLQYVLGETNSAYDNLGPWFRNLDRIAINGSNWYSILELSNELTSETSNIAVLVKSTDSGANWEFVSLIAYTTSVRTRILEASVVILNSVYHVIYRMSANTIGYTYSSDGTTWSSPTTIPISTIASKPTAINYYKTDGSIGVLFACNLVSEISGNTYRTTLAIYDTSNFSSFTEIAKIVTNSYAHYPSLCHFGRSLYCSYTKAMKMHTDGDSNTTHTRDTIVVAKIT